MVVKEAYTEIIHALEKIVPDPHGEAAIIMSSLYGLTRLDLVLKADEILPDTQRWEPIVARRLNNEPLAYILGETYFFGRLFYSRAPVLIPRQDSEFLLDMILQASTDKLRVLELGVGSGALCVTLALERPSWSISGVDINPDAIALSKENADRHGVQISLFEGDGFTKIEGTYDIIYSNPPYIPSEEVNKLDHSVSNYESHTALDGGEDGYYFYRQWIPEARKHLFDGGILAFETGYNQGDYILEIMKQNDFRDLHLIHDLAGWDRVVIGRKR
ncbi:MAG: peptide chain release factor N(5)-glutamine methyltransferase [Tissierellia bacterium]|nr:peptide chain release factor N(5)-glutamine methyltransferase [Tissierellia bacterium]